MKLPKIFIVYVIFLHLLAGYALYRSNLLISPIASPVEIPPMPTPTPPISFNESRRELLMAVDQTAPKGSIAFLGDSFTQSLPVSLLSSKAVNFGINGETSKGLADRINDYKSLPKAKAVVLEIGTNDLFKRTNNFAELAEKLPSEPVIYWYAVPPVDTHIIRNFNNQQVKQTNNDLRILCEARPNCTFIDLTAQYTDETGNLRADYHIGDGIHLNAAGYRIWIADLKSRKL